VKGIRRKIVAEPGLAPSAAVFYSPPVPTPIFSSPHTDRKLTHQARRVPVARIAVTARHVAGGAGSRGALERRCARWSAFRVRGSSSSIAMRLTVGVAALLSTLSRAEAVRRRDGAVAAVQSTFLTLLGER